MKVLRMFLFALIGGFLSAVGGAWAQVLRHALLERATQRRSLGSGEAGRREVEERVEAALGEFGVNKSARHGHRAAEQLGVAVKRISVRDQSSRWGSCSTTGLLSFSWRLVMAPPLVLDYVAAHEVAHLAEMNHGPRFWRLVVRMMPQMEEAKFWLRRNGMDLHRYGADA